MRGLPRLTTREAAEVLECKPAEALALLRAASVPHVRMGRRGPILWDATAAEHLRDVLAGPAKDEGRAS